MTTETAYKEQPVQKQVCAYKYDSYENRDIYKCTYETRYENRPYEKTVYVIQGAVPRMTYNYPLGAFNAAVQSGALRWRLVQ
jgi:hypothetical protein